MRPEPKKRVETNPKQPGLNDAFAKLNLDSKQLPPGPMRNADAPQQIWKMGRVILRRETARRGGKTVIVVHDFATHLPASVIETIARKLRQTCGCGGTVKGRTIEVQLDQPSRVRAVLEGEGFEVAGVR
jgi:translation initiation factor 1